MNYCIYCFEQDAKKMCKAHLFPQCIGGRFWFDNCCKSCNNILGYRIESQIKDCVFLVTGISKLGIQSKDKAFKNIKIIDTETVDRLQYFKNDLFISPNH
jgi:hypothetical protein